MRGTTRGLISGLSAALVLLAACGDDDDGAANEKDSGPSAGRGGSSGSGGSSAGSGGTGSTITPLGDDVAGDECTTNMDCGGATCATTVPGASIIPAPTSAPGGYCTGQCANNADCGDGGACVGALAGVIMGQCFAACASDTDCRDEYVCAGGLTVAGITIPDTCRPKPDTDQLGDNVAGKPCMAAADCNGGSCLTVRGGFMGMGGTTMLPGGYCTGNCTEDSHCGEGGVCSPPLLEGLTGSCFEVCVGDGDCNRIGYRCLEIGPNLRGCDLFPDPLPDNQAGKACSSDADCGGVMDTCDTALPAPGLFTGDVPAPDGYCSQLCVEDADCGAGGVCIGAGIPRWRGACFKPCTAATDCRTGYTCAPRGGGGMGAPAAPAADGGMSTARMVCAPTPMMTNPDNDGGTE